MEYRKDLPPLPTRMQNLPLQRGYPVPWFVAKVKGEYDFRIVDPLKFGRAIQNKRCWICGGQLGAYMAFTIGPMCAVNRINSEPPSHKECALYAVQACPFLSMPQMKRNEHKLEKDKILPAAGMHIEHNPGAMAIWITKAYKVMTVENGVLLSLGSPEEVIWYTKGRLATLNEVLDAIALGLPILEAQADKEKIDHPFARYEIEDGLTKLQKWLPKETSKKFLFGSAARRQSYGK